jgi:hypothetical protein
VRPADAFIAEQIVEVVVFRSRLANRRVGSIILCLRRHHSLPTEGCIDAVHETPLLVGGVLALATRTEPDDVAAIHAGFFELGLDVAAEAVVNQSC